MSITISLHNKVCKYAYLASPSHVRKEKLSNLRGRCMLSSRAALLQFQNNESVRKAYVVSDLHTDYSENMTWVNRLSRTAYRKDILIVAGDVAESMKRFVLTMSLLKERFRHVFFVPGNHDVWCRTEDEPYVDSVEKVGALIEMCNDLEVFVEPKCIGGVGIIPLYSWYHQSFDKEIDITGVKIPPLQLVCRDFSACKWPLKLSSSDLSLATFFDDMNTKNLEAIENIKEMSHQVITFSHFLPRPELCPEKRMLFFPNLPKVIGTDLLNYWLKRIHGPKGNSSACHVFGHTHFCWDSVVNGIRYIQVPLGYPKERQKRLGKVEKCLPYCVYDSEQGGLQNGYLPCFWSDYYRVKPREPDNVELAPWVASIYKRIK